MATQEYGRGETVQRPPTTPAGAREASRSPYTQRFLPPSPLPPYPRSSTRPMHARLAPVAETETLGETETRG